MTKKLKKPEGIDFCCWSCCDKSKSLPPLTYITRKYLLSNLLGHYFELTANLLGIYCQLTWKLLRTYCEFTWKLLGIYCELTWKLLGNYCEFTWKLLGIYLEITANLLRIYLKITWELLGNYCELTGKLPHKVWVPVLSLAGRQLCYGTYTKGQFCMELVPVSVKFLAWVVWRSTIYIIRSYHLGYTGSHPNSEVKQGWAYLVLWWGTTRES